MQKLVHRKQQSLAQVLMLSLYQFSAFDRLRTHEDNETYGPTVSPLLKANQKLSL